MCNLCWAFGPSFLNNILEHKRLAKQICHAYFKKNTKKKKNKTELREVSVPQSHTFGLSSSCWLTLNISRLPAVSVLLSVDPICLSVVDRVG